MERITSMKERGFIRRLSGFFSLDRLEYCSVLCGMRIPAERIEEMADILREIPGVTHNYLRDHDFNMWFALIAENREKLGAEIERIRGSGIPEKLISLPKTRKFKIHLALDPKSEDDSAPDVRKDAKAGGAL